MSLPYSLAERIQALRSQIERLLQERSRVDREIQEALAMLEHYLAVWEAESVGLRTRQPRGTESAPQAREATAPAAPRGALPASGRARRSVYQLVVEALESRADALHSNEVTELVRQNHPDVAAAYSDLPRQVGVALVRGVQRGVLERTGPNTFRRIMAPHP